MLGTILDIQFTSVLLQLIGGLPAAADLCYKPFLLHLIYHKQLKGFSNTLLLAKLLYNLYMFVRHVTVACLFVEGIYKLYNLQ